MKSLMTREHGDLALRRSGQHWALGVLLAAVLMSSCESDSEPPTTRPTAGSSGNGSGAGATSNGGTSPGGSASGGSPEGGGGSTAAGGTGGPVGGEANGGRPVGNAGAGGALAGQAGAGGGPISCTDTCPAGLECCDGHCVNPTNDPQNCGDCGTQCQEPAAFCQGSCVETPCTATCANQDSCCGNQCCGAGQICCLSTVGAIRPVCSDPVEGTCPVGCPSCE
jgi:hypothetical protein